MNFWEEPLVHDSSEEVINTVLKFACQNRSISLLQILERNSEKFDLIQKIPAILELLEFPAKIISSGVGVKDESSKRPYVVKEKVHITGREKGELGDLLSYLISSCNQIETKKEILNRFLGYLTNKKSRVAVPSSLVEKSKKLMSNAVYTLLKDKDIKLDFSLFQMMYSYGICSDPIPTLVNLIHSDPHGKIDDGLLEKIIRNEFDKNESEQKSDGLAKIIDVIYLLQSLDIGKDNPNQGLVDLVISFSKKFAESKLIIPFSNNFEHSEMSDLRNMRFLDHNHWAFESIKSSRKDALSKISALNKK